LKLINYQTITSQLPVHGSKSVTEYSPTGNQPPTVCRSMQQSAVMSSDG